MLSISQKVGFAAGRMLERLMSCIRYVGLMYIIRRITQRKWFCKYPAAFLFLFLLWIMLLLSLTA